MPTTKVRAVAAALALAVAMLPAARADDIETDPLEDEEKEPARFGSALLESAITLGVIAGYYINGGGWTSDNSDADLHWDWPSWKRKLSLDAVRFDTNEYHVNVTRHGLMGVVTYQIGRTNGLGIVGSTVLSAIDAVVWEFVIEYRESPSINDLILNTVLGYQLAEPLWQIGQLWRGGVLSVGDRLKTTMFSPFDGLHDLVRRPRHHWWRPRAWRSMTFELGGSTRWDDRSDARTELVLSGDIDLVGDRRYVSPGAQEGRIAPGTWSRVRGRLRFGDSGSGFERSATEIESRTALAGYYQQDARGNGVFAGIGAGFTYHRENVNAGRDHVTLAHLAGLQLQLSRRTPALAMRWDVAAYGDFAMIDAHRYRDGNPFRKPPPYLSKLQTQGYYDGLGVTGTTRLRVDTRLWSFDAELSAHQVWQIDAGERIAVSLRSAPDLGAHGVSDFRLYWRAQLGFRPGRLGASVIAEGSDLRGTWEGSRRESTSTAIGIALQASY
ncbi:MAG: hypothetical protein JWP01_2839 [Myxococcales bacterium]|nr:hypothetical protein [Myxococcales bacterium]